MQTRKIAVENGICPQCGDLLIYPRGDTPYCEECGYPDENFNDTEAACKKGEVKE